MAKHILKDVEIRTAKPQKKRYRMSDGNGLYININTNGSKAWRFDYTYEGDRKTLSFGIYPAVSLSDVRRKADDARKSIALNINPSDIRKEERANKRKTIENESRLIAGLPALNSFADVANKWLLSVVHLTNLTTHTKKTARIKLHAFPILGDISIDKVKSSDMRVSRILCK